MDDIAWSGPEFEAKVNANLRASAKRHRVTITMENRLLQMFGDNRVNAHDQTMVALHRRGLVCSRQKPVNMLWGITYFILSDLGIRQAERILMDRIENV